MKCCICVNTLCLHIYIHVDVHIYVRGGEILFLLCANIRLIFSNSRVSHLLTWPSIFFFFQGVEGLYPITFRDHSWIYTQKLLLNVLGGHHMWRWSSIQGRPNDRQTTLCAINLAPGLVFRFGAAAYLRSLSQGWKNRIEPFPLWLSTVLQLRYLTLLFVGVCMLQVKLDAEL